VLVAVPTLFTVFPSFTDWPTWSRALILVGWVVVAAGAGLLTNQADDRLHKAIRADQEAAIVAEHRATIRDQFTTLLQPQIVGIPDQYPLSVSVPTPDNQFLIPVFPPVVSLQDPSIFPVGAGAVGRLWASPDGGSVVIKGPAVSGPDHELTKLRQTRYSMFKVVAAAAILDVDGRRIGALSAICRNDDGFFDEETGITALNSLARGLAWIIPEAVKWMLPRTEEVK
jgi:hypothetical protein